MMQDSKQSQYAHLSEPNPAWLQVSEKHAEIEKLATKLYSLPIEEFRKIPYKPAPLHPNAPQPGTDLNIRTGEVTVRDGSIMRIRVYTPLALKTNHPLFYNMHGGGWTVGIPETEEGQNRIICSKNDAVVVSIDYRKAPEFPFPHAVYDSYDGLLWCIEHAADLGINPEKIIIGGGSAGANLAAAVSLLARDSNVHGIIGQILNIPVTCHPAHFPKDKFEYNSYEQNKDSPIVNAHRMNLFWNYYLPSADDTPLASPLLAESHKGLPPALVQVAGMDPLRDEGLAYAGTLKQSQVKTTLKIYPGMPHAFYMYPTLQPSIEYNETMVDWISSILVD